MSEKDPATVWKSASPLRWTDIGSTAQNPSEEASGARSSGRTVRKTVRPAIRTAIACWNLLTGQVGISEQLRTRCGAWPLQSSLRLWKPGQTESLHAER